MFGTSQRGSSGGSGCGTCDVDDRGTDVPTLERLDQRTLVDERAACDIAEHRAGLHRREHGRVEVSSVSGVAGALSTTASQQAKTSWSESVPNSSSQTGEVSPGW